ncbi:hypothetical protein L211DRAFT_102649 [Terfezia boudieri ATCC MYA-4762]|uniref:Uncharacterized protein n=1 Tax=Terfezia boudieri ATCC MYA-4762 TaxID=1051890 RepID=A0A3N4LQN1_9PEZI|nr:hypothetical protein L211DRAFT_102649 [Terfezia boudieri ATCC MYA-4762]
MASQSESAESVGVLGQEHDLRMTRPSLVEEGIVSKELPPQFGGHYPIFKEDDDTVMAGATPVEAESDDGGVDMAAEQAVIREAMKMLRDRRHRGYDDKLRVQRRIGKRRAQPIQQKVKKGKQRAEEIPEESGRRECKERSRSSPSSRAPKPVQEYITPSCVRGSYRVPLAIPSRAPPSPTLVASGFTSTTLTLLAQLKEIELRPPMIPPEVDEAMLSPIASPALPLKGEGEVRKLWNGEAIQGQYSHAMECTHTAKQLPQTSPYEMRDRGCSPLSESPSP